MQGLSSQARGAGGRTLPGSVQVPHTHQACHTFAGAALSAWEAFPHTCKLLAILQSPLEALPCPHASHSLPPAPRTASTDPVTVPGGYSIMYTRASLTGQGPTLAHLCSPHLILNPEPETPIKRHPGAFPSGGTIQAPWPLWPHSSLPPLSDHRST